MVIDTSAILALLLNEEEASLFADYISRDSKKLISAGNVLEAMIVIEAKKGEMGGHALDLLLHRAKIDIVPLGGEQVEEARKAYRVYGKGKHKAALNFGDCMAYALAKTSQEPLLFKGDDFSQTDLLSVHEKHQNE